MTFRRVSTVRSTGGGERRIVDSWRDRGTSQDLLQEWTGSTGFRKSWEGERPNEATSSGRPPAGLEGCHPSFFYPFRSKARGRTSAIQCINTKYWWLNREERPELVIGPGMCMLFCSVLYHEPIRGGAWSCAISVVHRRSLSSVHDTLGVPASRLPRAR